MANGEEHRVALTATRSHEGVRRAVELQAQFEFIHVLHRNLGLKKPLISKVPALLGLKLATKLSSCCCRMVASAGITLKYIALPILTLMSISEEFLMVNLELFKAEFST